MSVLLPRPHGTHELQPLLLQVEEAEVELQRAQTLTKVPLSAREFGDLLMLGIGAFTPLTGFMRRDDWLSVCDTMHLANGLFWPIPITLSASREIASVLKPGQDIALVMDHGNDEIVATMKIEEIYTIDKTHECIEVFQATDTDHPGAALVMQQGECNLAGNVKVLSLGSCPQRFPNFILTPMQTRELFTVREWHKVAAFQTRNPMHRAHEHLVKSVLEWCDGIFIHSIIGELKQDDIPAEKSIAAINILIKNYFIKDAVVHAGYPLAMRYAGPREALLHAVFRQNYGCHYLIVGRDHAGIKNYYGAYDAHNIFDQIPKQALQIRPIKLAQAFWCHRCDGMASTHTCPHSKDQRMLLSGTKLRELLRKGEAVPDHFSRPEVLDILRKHYQENGLVEK